MNGLEKELNAFFSALVSMVGIANPLDEAPPEGSSASFTVTDGNVSAQYAASRAAIKALT